MACYFKYCKSSLKSRKEGRKVGNMYIRASAVLFMYLALSALMAYPATATGSDLVVKIAGEQLRDIVFQTPQGRQAYQYYFALQNPKEFVVSEICKDESMSSICKAKDFASNPLNVLVSEMCSDGGSQCDFYAGVQTVLNMRNMLANPQALMQQNKDLAAIMELSRPSALTERAMAKAGMANAVSLIGKVSGYLAILTADKTNAKGAKRGSSGSSITGRSVGLEGSGDSGSSGRASGLRSRLGEDIIPGLIDRESCNIGLNVINTGSKSIAELGGDEAAALFGDIIGRECVTVSEGDISLFMDRPVGMARAGSGCFIQKRGPEFEIKVRKKGCYASLGKREYRNMAENSFIVINLTSFEIDRARIVPDKDSEYVFFGKKYKVHKDTIIEVNQSKVKFKFITKKNKTISLFVPEANKFVPLTVIEGAGLIAFDGKIYGKSFIAGDKIIRPASKKGTAVVKVSADGVEAFLGTKVEYFGFEVHAPKGSSVFVTGKKCEHSGNCIQITDSRVSAFSDEKSSFKFRANFKNRIFQNLEYADYLEFEPGNGDRVDIIKRAKSDKIPLVVHRPSDGGETKIYNGKKIITLTDKEIFMKPNDDGGESVAMRLESSSKNIKSVLMCGNAQNFAIQPKSIVGEYTVMVDPVGSLPIYERLSDAQKEVQSVRQLLLKYKRQGLYMDLKISALHGEKVDPFILNILDQALGRGKIVSRNIVLSPEINGAFAASGTLMFGTEYFSPDKHPEHIPNFYEVVLHENNHARWSFESYNERKMLAEAIDRGKRVDLGTPETYTMQGLANIYTEKLYNEFKDTNYGKEVLNEMSNVAEEFVRESENRPEIRDYKEIMENLVRNRKFLEKNPGLFADYLAYIKFTSKEVKDSELGKRADTLIKKSEEACRSIGLRRCYLFKDYSANPKSRFYSSTIQEEIEENVPAKKGDYKEFPTVINEATIEEMRNHVQNAPNKKLAKIHKDIAHLNYELGFITREDCEYITGEKCTKCQVYKLPCTLSH